MESLAFYLSIQWTCTIAAALASDGGEAKGLSSTKAFAPHRQRRSTWTCNLPRHSEYSTEHAPNTLINTLGIDAEYAV